jgi:hypothetical protein
LAFCQKLRKLTWTGVGMSQDLEIVFTELE